MKILDMFEKSIQRPIQGVIKADQDTNDVAKQELDEYVVTSEIENYMERFFRAYGVGIGGSTDKIGVWISGFFGSGKSHFLKILSYLLENRPVEGDENNRQTASEFFLDGKKTTNAKILEGIEKAAEISKDTDVILFNIDSKSSSDSRHSKDAIVEVFMKVFNEKLGYCGAIPFLAELERKIDDVGKYDAFRVKFEEINGNAWKSEREDFYFIQDEIVECLVSLDIMSENEANNWIENGQDTYNKAFDIHNFAKIVKRYCENKGKNHHVLFLVDEIGQYIAGNGGDDLTLNLQTVTEDLGTACGGKVWIIVTSQQDIDSITKTAVADTFSKIQARFDTRIALSSANVDEVIRKRILKKNEQATNILADLFDHSEANMKNIITFSDGTTDMPLYQDRLDFADVYPFIPYQFNLLGDVLTAIRKYSASGKNLADGERSMLALFKEAAEKIEDQREGVIVPFNLFYGALEDFIDHQHRVVIVRAMSNSRLTEFDVELLKILFMIKHVSEKLPATPTNLTTLMISDVNEERKSLQDKVEEGLRNLCNEQLVQKNGNIYTFLTNEEQEVNYAISKETVEDSQIISQVAQLAFDEIIAIPNNKYSYSKRYQFPFNQKIDDRFHRGNQNHDITLHLMTAYSGEQGEVALQMLSAQEKSVIVHLSDEYGYLQEIEEMLKITQFLNKPANSGMTDYEVIAAVKRKERKERLERIKKYIGFAIENAGIYVDGESANIKTKTPVDRVNEALEKLVLHEYSKLSDMTMEPGASDVMEMLKSSKSQMTLQLDGVSEPNRDALSELMSKISFAHSTAAKFSVKQAMDKMMAAPYGYVQEDIQYLIATLYRQGKISMKMNGAVYTPASTSPDEAYKFITKREYLEKVLLEVKEVPQTKWIKSVKDVIKDFFGKTSVSDEADSLMRDFRNYSTIKRRDILEKLGADYKSEKRLPGKSTLEKAVRLMDDVSGIQDPMTFFKRVDDLYDDFIDTADLMIDIWGFLTGSQKKIFTDACKTYDVFEASKNYISDTDIIELATQVNKILHISEPYSFIKKLDDYEKQLGNAIVELLEKDAKRIEPDIYADRKIVMESFAEERPYTDRLKGIFEDKFRDLIEKMQHTNDVAALNGIPSESNALCQNCLNEIAKAEANYQKSLQVENPDKPVVTPPVKTIQTVQVSMRSLSSGQSVMLKDEADVDAFVEKIRAELMSKLGENTIIKLS